MYVGEQRHTTCSTFKALLQNQFSGAPEKLFVEFPQIGGLLIEVQ
jgi:hypothetical protein